MKALHERVTYSLLVALFLVLPTMVASWVNVFDRSFQTALFIQNCLSWAASLAVVYAIAHAVVYFYAFDRTYAYEPKTRFHIPVRVEQPPIPGRGIGGYVYLLRTDVGMYKIGHTANPDNRIRTLSKGCPFAVAYEHLIPCNNRFQAEHSLHERYADQRVRGEWFRLTPAQVNEIKQIEEM